MTNSQKRNYIAFPRKSLYCDNLLRLGLLCLLFVLQNTTQASNFTIGESIKLPTPVRWWQRHKGKYWNPNGIDNVYRIENGLNGGALTIPEDGSPAITHQFQALEAGNRQRLSFEKAGAKPGEYKIYILSPDKSKKYYLSSLPQKKRVQVIEIEELNVFGKDSTNGQILDFARDATGKMSSRYGVYKPENAIDGRLETFSHTLPTSNPWYELDLGIDKKIDKIELHLRNAFCHRLRNADVYVKKADGTITWQGKLVGNFPLHSLDLPEGTIGRYVKIEHDYTKENVNFVFASENPEGKDRIWLMEQIDPNGYYKIVNTQSGKVLNFDMIDGVDVMTEGNLPIKLDDYDSKKKTMRWTIEPVCDRAIDILAASQIGWVPKAPQKLAYLVRRKKLTSEPEWYLTESAKNGLRILLQKGKAKYADSGFGLFFYTIDITPLQKEGRFWLDCDGDRTDIYIAKDAYSRINHRGGSDYTTLDEIIDGKGFVGYWSHLERWINPKFIPEPYIKTKNFKTGQEKIITPKKRADSIIGGWDHTDRYWSAIQPISELLRQLVFTHDICCDKSLKNHIVNEMLYGVEYLLRIQNKDGSWPFRFFIANKLTGTVCAVGGAFAQAYPIIKQRDQKLGEQMLKSLTKAWNWVQKHPNDWVPVKVDYRHGRSDELMMFALEIYLITNDEKAKSIAFDWIKNAKVREGCEGYQVNGALIKKSGEFQCQAISPATTIQSLLSMRRHYKELPENIQNDITRLEDEFYHYLLHYKDFAGVFGAWEKELGGYGSTTKWMRRANFLYRMYSIDPKKYKKGFFVAEHAMDWMFGVNPFATSQVCGFGNRFLCEGWSRPYLIGGALPGLTAVFNSKGIVWPIILTPSTQGYGNGESEASQGVVLIQDMLLRDKFRKNTPTK